MNRTLVLAPVLLLLLAAAPVSAQPAFELTSPTEGSLVPAGQPITVTWTGGDPSWNVNLQGIDVAANTVVDHLPEQGGFGVGPNTGSRIVTLGTERCGRQYRFYVENAQRTGWRYGPVFTVVCRIAVGIDIKPGNFPNSINLGSAGTTPVAILGSATFNIKDIDVSTLTLGTAGVKTVGKTDRFMCSVTDVSGNFTSGPEGLADGFLDLVCHFVTVNIVPEEGGTTATVKGDLINSLSFEGSDSVNVVP